MLPAAAVLLVALAVPAAGSGSGMADAMMDTVNKVISGKGRKKCAGPTCCTQSTCYIGPGVGCDKARGKTQCIGAKLFPVPLKGMCSCVTGACGEDGRCPDAPPLPSQSAGFQEGQSQASGPAGAPSGWSRLYAEAAAPTGQIPPEDFTLAFGVLGVAGVSLSLLGAAAGLRLHRRRREDLQQGFLRANEDCFNDHEDGRFDGHSSQEVYVE